MRATFVVGSSMTRNRRLVKVAHITLMIAHDMHRLSRSARTTRKLAREGESDHHNRRHKAVFHRGAQSH